MDVGGWLRRLGLEQYEAAFRENKIDDTVLPSLTAEDLKDLGVGLVGHRRKLLGAITALRAEASAPTPLSDAPLETNKATKDSAERRQVTVMFADLVGSTALSARMDPEDLREIISVYRACVADTMRRFGGFVAKYMGDGVLIYFGYPRAHEDDSERAVRAGLDLVERVAALNLPVLLQVRVGMATGLVVVGDLVGSGEAQERGIIGETPNLAARLQGIAAPNMVVLADDTRRLVGNLFELQDLGIPDLKGITGSVRAWAAVRPSGVEGRFEALHTGDLSGLVGREEELGLLLRRWSRAKIGEGQVILLSGEAGIGKSRLTAALSENLALEPHTRLRYFCSPQQTDSALFPVISQLMRGALLAHDDSPQAKMDKLDTLLAQNSTSPQDAALIAELLSLPNDGRYHALRFDPQQRRQKTLEALGTQIEALTRRNPVLMIFEDAHWSDPTSFEWLDRAIDLIVSRRVLLLVTFRSEFNPPWIGRPHVTALPLNRLTRRDTDTLIDQVVGNRALPANIRQDIVERTDGIPLFVEELTKAVLDVEGEREAHRLGAGVPPPAMVPATLQASLMARLDRLGSAREVLQIGAAMGREFSYEDLAAVAGFPAAVLQDALIRLTEAELLFLHGRPPSAIYIFKHALIQDTAYSTMLRARRQQLHHAIALVLEKRFVDGGNATPEIIARQFESADDAMKAVQYWRRAGERDVHRSAMKEAIAHFTHAQRLIGSIPDTPERADVELGVCLGLGMAHQIGTGPASKESGDAYRRALQLAEALPGNRRERFLANWGIWFHTTMQRGAGVAASLANRLVDSAREADDSDLLLEAYHAKVPALFWQGEIAAAKEAALQVINRYDREQHRDHAYYFGGHDARVCAEGFLALCLWGLGFAEQAKQTVFKSTADARSLGHTFSLAHALNLGSLMLMMSDDIDACRAIADELHPLAERHKFPWPLTQARFLQGWLAVKTGNGGGIQQMLDALDQPAAANVRPMLLGITAFEQLRAGRHSDAAILADRAKNNYDFLFYRPETLRLCGELLLAQSRENAAQAEAIFHEAIASAAQQSCRALELRAACSLARLLAEVGRNGEAHKVLAPVYATFSEGLEGPDLRAARDLLEQV